MYIITRMLLMDSKALLESNIFLLANFFTDTYLLKGQTSGIKPSVALDLKMKCKFGFFNYRFFKLTTNSRGLGQRSG